MTTTAEQQSAAAVVIGLKEVYEQLVRLTDRVGEMRGDLRQVTDRQLTLDQRLVEHAASDGRQLADHESRLRGLERRGWLLAGAAAALGTGGGYLATLIGGG